jgi:LemA protein
MTALIILGLIVLFVLYFIMIYNSFVALKNRVTEAWSDIEVQMKRRYELIPNLVATVKGYASHESATLEKVVQARNVAMNCNHKDIESVTKNENALSSTLKSIFALSENYPDLKANANFLKLQDELTDTEDKLQASRRFYNSNVMKLNTQIEMFPSNVVANFFAFKQVKFFELGEDEQEAKKVVQVKF